MEEERKKPASAPKAKQTPKREAAPTANAKSKSKPRSLPVTSKTNCGHSDATDAEFAAKKQECTICPAALAFTLQEQFVLSQTRRNQAQALELRELKTKLGPPKNHLSDLKLNLAELQFRGLQTHSALQWTPGCVAMIFTLSYACTKNPANMTLIIPRTTTNEFTRTDGNHQIQLVV